MTEIKFGRGKRHRRDAQRSVFTMRTNERPTDNNRSEHWLIAPLMSSGLIMSGLVSDGHCVLDLLTIYQLLKSAPNWVIHRTTGQQNSTSVHHFPMMSPYLVGHLTCTKYAISILRGLFPFSLACQHGVLRLFAFLRDLLFPWVFRAHL